METEDFKCVIRGFRNVGIGAAILVAIFGVTASTILGMILYPLFLKSEASPELETALYVGIGLGVTLVLALAALGLFWGFGWVLAGIGTAIDERLRKRRDGIENGKDE